jgi:hypothetical protein
MWKESVVVMVVTMVSMAHKDNIFCGLFNDDGAIAEYIVSVVRELVKWTKSVRRLAGSSSYPSILMFIKTQSCTTRKQIYYVNSFGFANQPSSYVLLIKTVK